MTSRDTRAATAAVALLSPGVIRPVLNTGQRSPIADATVRRLVDAGFANGISTVRALVWRCDRWLAAHHRSDLVYRKAVVGLFARAGRRSSVLIPEFRANRSVVDLVAVTDRLHAVEIKSDLDNSSRLARQLADFRRIASFVSLAGPRRLVERVAPIVDFENVGLYWLNDGGTLEELRPPILNTELLDSGLILRSLRRAEYIAAIGAFGVRLETLPNTQVFSTALRTAQGIDALEFEREVASVLRRRRPQAGASTIARLPAPIRPAILKLNPTRRGIENLYRWLDQEISNVYA